MKRFVLAATIVLMTFSLTDSLEAQDKPLTIENYDKIKWGYADEFIALWKKNHYPLLEKLKEKGDIIDIKAETPIIHSGEDTRWDFKVTITSKQNTWHSITASSIPSRNSFSLIRTVMPRPSSIVLS